MTPPRAPAVAPEATHAPTHPNPIDLLEAEATPSPATSEATPTASAPALSGRRRFLQSAGAGALVAAAAAAAPAPARAQEAAPDATQAGMRRVSGAEQAQARETEGASSIAWAEAVAATASPEVIALNRMGFGPRPGDLAKLMAMGASSDARLQAYVEQQLNPGAIDDSDVHGRIAAQGFTTLTKTRTQLWQEHLKAPNLDWSERIRPLTETLHATFLRAIYSKRQLAEVLTDFWHNHFNVYAWDIWGAATWVHTDRDVIRANLFGNFRTMLDGIARSPAMLYYLDNVSNTGAGPNENFARELIELHTMGAENYMGVQSIVDPNTGEYRHPAPKDANNKPLLYVDEDVYAATQCFTGWRIHDETGEFFFDDSVHEKYSKTVLAYTLASGAGEDDGRRVLDILANHAGTAHYICRKLCRRLISDDPPESVVQAAANVWMANRTAPDQLRKVVRTILLSNEFRTIFSQKMKRPFEFAMSAIRATNTDFAYDDNFRWRFETLGQPLFSWRPPNGYPDTKEAWNSTMLMLQRWRYTTYLVDWWRYPDDGSGEEKTRFNMRVQMPASVRTPNAVVDFWVDRMLGRALPSEERTALVNFMAAGRNPDADLPDGELEDRPRFLVGLLLSSPSFQWR